MKAAWHSETMRRFVWGAVCVVSVWAGLAVGVQAQPRLKCEMEYQAAWSHYLQGRFETSVVTLSDCVDREVLFKAEARQVYRLFALAYLGQEDPERAERAVETILAIDPEYTADPVQDPPTYFTLVTLVRDRLKLPDASETETVPQVEQPVVAPDLPIEAEPSVPAPRRVWWSRPRNVVVALGGMLAVSAALGLVAGGNQSPPPSGM